MVNKVILIGNLGDNPEVRTLPSGTPIATFSMATNESFKDKNGNLQTQTEWHNIEVWDQLAKIAEAYLKKGSLIYLEGKIKTETWTDKEGQNRRTVKIRANSFTMLGKKDSSSDGSSNASAQQQNHDSVNQQANFNSSSSEDLPF